MRLELRLALQARAKNLFRLALLDRSLAAGLLRRLPLGNGALDGALAYAERRDGFLPAEEDGRADYL
jgi:hypothetical protein